MIDRALGSSYYTIYIGLYIGHTLGLPSYSHYSDDPPPRILYTSYIRIPYIQSPNTYNIVSVVDGV